MALGDIVVKDQNVMTGAGAHLYNVAAGTQILAGEPVQLRALGLSVVQPGLTNAQVVGTDFIVGIASTSSTNTASAAGTVYVTPLNNAITYLIAPTTAGTWNEQSEYDALVGDRVLIANSATVSGTPGNSGSYTIGATDSANNGCVVQALDVAIYPGKVAFAFRTGLSNLA